EVAQPRTVSLAAADEDRSTAIAVTSRAAALLTAPLLAGTSHVRPLAGRAGGAAPVLELPGDDAVQDIGARLDTENGVVKLNVAGRLAVEFLDLHLHGSALLIRVGVGRIALGLIVLGADRRGVIVTGTSLLLLEQLFLLLGRDFGLHFVLGRGLDHPGRRLIALGSRALPLNDSSGERRTFRKRQLHRIADEEPSVLRAGHGTFDEDQAAGSVGAHDFQVLLGALLVAHVAGHLLVLEDLARILALTGRAVRTVTY